MEPQEFKRQLDELRTIIADGIAYFSAWRGLKVEDEDTAQALNRYRGLFLPAKIALESQALMQFAKVFDNNPKAVSLRNLLTAANENRQELTPYATEEDLQEIEQKITYSENLLTKLKHYRDTRLAHHDAIVAGDTTILYGEFSKFVEEVQSMFNSLATGHNQLVTSFDKIARDSDRHGGEVVQIMREDRDKRIQSFKKLDTAT
jgi:uncharacterized protein YaaQ